MWMMCLSAAVYFVAAAFLFSCVLATRFHSRWFRYIRYRAAVLPRFVAKPFERGFLSARVGRVLMVGRIRGRNLVVRAAEFVVVCLVAAEILCGEIVVVWLCKKEPE